MEKKEYTIFCIYGKGLPFYLNTYKTIEEAKRKIIEIVNTEEKRNRPYFIDNDFFENKYPSKLSNSKYFMIQERFVSCWKKYEEISAKEKNKDNIIYFIKNS